MDHTKFQPLIDEIIHDTPDAHQAADVRRAIECIVAARPDSRFDESFKRRLKDDILSQPLREKQSFFQRFIFDLNSMQKVLYALGGGVAVIALALVLTSLPGAQRPGPGSLAYATTVEQVGKNAFGNLSGAVTAATDVRGSAPIAGATSGAISEAAPMIGSDLGGGMGVASSMPVGEKIAAPAATGAATSMIAPLPWPNFRYVYTGDTLPLEEAERSVYKRIKNKWNLPVSALRGFSPGVIDLSSFGGANVRQFEIVEDVDKGYAVHVNLDEGIVSINQNWTRWNSCKFNECAALPPLTAADVMPDDEALAIARRFLEDHGIPTDQYGTPEVEKNQEVYHIMDKRLMGTAEEGAPIQYIPDMITVVYPSLINGQEVYEMGGGKVGVRVSIGIRDKKVTNVWELRRENLQSSLYAAETDFDRLVKFAERGGSSSYGYYQPPKDAPAIELGTPTLVLAKVWRNDPKTFEGYELFAPTFLFPVVKAPVGDGVYYPKQVMVPLIKEILADYDAVPQPLPEPMPVDVPGGEGGPASPPADVKPLPAPVPPKEIR